MSPRPALFRSLPVVLRGLDLAPIAPDRALAEYLQLDYGGAVARAA